MNQYEKYSNLYENNFKEEKSHKDAHQKDWEIILSGYLNEHGFKIKRGNPEKSNLDFILNCNKIIHIEATAPTRGQGQNKVPKVPNLSIDQNILFNACIRNDDLILLRYTSCIAEKLKQIHKKNISQNEPIILAINDYEFIDTWQLNDDVPIIAQILFGLTNPMYNPILKNNIYLQRDDFLNKNNSNIKNDYFRDKNTLIYSIILSSINKKNAEYNEITKDKFLYIQNPLKEDLSYLFKDCMNILNVASLKVTDNHQKNPINFIKNIIENYRN